MTVVHISDLMGHLRHINPGYDVMGHLLPDLLNIQNVSYFLLMQRIIHLQQNKTKFHRNYLKFYFIKTLYCIVLYKVLQIFTFKLLGRLYINVLPRHLFI
jgi:hypothetical protein